MTMVISQCMNKYWDIFLFHIIGTQKKAIDLSMTFIKKHDLLFVYLNQY